jgi:hypothetical protein
MHLEKILALDPELWIIGFILHIKDIKAAITLKNKIRFKFAHVAAESTCRYFVALLELAKQAKPISLNELTDEIFEKHRYIEKEGARIMLGVKIRTLLTDDLLRNIYQHVIVVVEGIGEIRRSQDFLTGSFHALISGKKCIVDIPCSLAEGIMLNRLIGFDEK